MIHIILILLLKIVYDIVPSITQETSWTMVNITYMAGSYLMFHYVRGIPFEFNAGAYDNLNMWEQIDNEDQYTPAKKFLLAMPIGLFLISTHYTHYDLAYFMINFLATLAVVVPKLPAVSTLLSVREFRHNLMWFLVPSHAPRGLQFTSRVIRRRQIAEPGEVQQECFRHTAFWDGKIDQGSHHSGLVLICQNICLAL